MLCCIRFEQCIMRKRFKSIIKWGILSALVAGGVYVWKFSPVEAESRPVKNATLQVTVFGTGTLEAKTRVSISP